MSNLHLNIVFPWQHADVIIPAPAYTMGRPNKLIEDAIEKALNILLKRGDSHVEKVNGAYVLQVDAENAFSLKQVFECIGTHWEIVKVIPWDVRAKDARVTSTPMQHVAQATLDRSPGDFWQ